MASVGPNSSSGTRRCLAPAPLNASSGCCGERSGSRRAFTLSRECRNTFARSDMQNRGLDRHPYHRNKPPSFPEWAEILSKSTPGTARGRVACKRMEPRNTEFIPFDEWRYPSCNLGVTFQLTASRRSALELTPATRSAPVATPQGRLKPWGRNTGRVGTG